MWDLSLSQRKGGHLSLPSRTQDDGVDIHFFNDRTTATSKSSAELLQLFRRVFPSKSTPSASALSRVLDPYVSVRTSVSARFVM